jgi:hypothetical protein
MISVAEQRFRYVAFRNAKGEVAREELFDRELGDGKERENRLDAEPEAAERLRKMERNYGAAPRATQPHKLQMTRSSRTAARARPRCRDESGAGPVCAGGSQLPDSAGDSRGIDRMRRKGLLAAKLAGAAAALIALERWVRLHAQVVRSNGLSQPLTRPRRIRYEAPDPTRRIAAMPAVRPSSRSSAR